MSFARKLIRKQLPKKLKCKSCGCKNLISKQIGNDNYLVCEKCGRERLHNEPLKN